MVFVQAEKAQKPRSQAAKVAAWIYAGILTVMTLAQLFEFENFVPLLQDMQFPGGDGTGTLIACLLVFMQVFAVPSLLRMPLSIAMRWCSMAFGLIVPLLWFGVGVWVLAGAPDATMNGGILGTKVHLDATVQAGGSAVLFALATWSAWGLWPARKK